MTSYQLVTGSIINITILINVYYGTPELFLHRAIKYVDILYTACIY